MTTQTTDTTQAPKTGHQETPNTPEQLTVLKSTSDLAKTWQADGTIAQWSGATQYTLEQHKVGSVHDLYRLMQELSEDPKRCLVRGKPAAGLPQKFARNGENFADEPSRLFVVDVDHFRSKHHSAPWADPEAVIEEVIGLLPPEFLNVSCIAHLSGSCGHPTTSEFKVHLFFWLDKPMTCAAAELYTKARLRGIGDAGIPQKERANFTSNPVMAPGVVDPLQGRRLLFMSSVLDVETLTLPALSDAELALVNSGPRKPKHEMGDPRDKDKVIGAVCRAFPVETITKLLEGEFTRSPIRKGHFDWVGHGPGGVFIGDTGAHLISSHDTAPTGQNKAVNMFDFLRRHMFGELDVLPDDEAVDITDQPSYQVMEAWALQQPEVHAEMTSDAAQAATVARAEKMALVLAETAETAERVLDDYREQIDRTTSGSALKALCARLCLVDNLDDVDREGLAQAVKLRYKNLGSPISIGAARAAIAPVSKQGADTVVFPRRDRAGNPSLTIPNVTALCAARGVTIRYNVITKRQEILGPECNFSVDNYENASLAWLQSECVDAGLPDRIGTLKGYITAIADRNQFNPVQVWLESKEWDGVDRLPALYATIQHDRDAIQQSTKELMIRKWMMQAVAGACSPVALQLRGVLVVQGEQNQGKTRWLQSLCPGHDDLVTTGRTLDPHNKDYVKTAISYWLCELGELDATFNKSDMAALKSMLAQDVDQLRLPYAAADSKFPRRTVFYGSVNTPQFLQDRTGNTRFWVIPALSMNPEHGLDMQQVWAQVLKLWKDGEAHWMTREEMEQVNANNEQHTPEDPIRDKIERLFNWEAFDVENPAILMTATQVCEELKLKETSNARVGAILKEMTGRSTKPGRPGGGGKTARLHGLPPRRASADKDFAEFTA